MVETKYLKNKTVIIQVPKQVINDNNRLVNSTTDKGHISNEAIILKPTNNEKVKIINDGNWIQRALNKKEEQKNLPKRPVGRPPKDAPKQPEVKKPVGRPPAPKAKSPQPKRPRGRPPKQVKVDNNGIQQADMEGIEDIEDKELDKRIYAGFTQRLVSDTYIEQQLDTRIYADWNKDIPLRLEVKQQQSVINLLTPKNDVKIDTLSQLPQSTNAKKFLLKPLPSKISAPVIPQSTTEERPKIPKPVLTPLPPTIEPKIVKLLTPTPSVKSKSSEVKEPVAWKPRSQTEEEEEDYGRMYYGSTTKSSVKSKSSEVIKPSSGSIGKKQKAVTILQRSLKRLLYPFINRVSANITDRLVYYKKIRTILEIKDIPNQGCFSYKDKQLILGNSIVLKKQIGSASKNGIVYLSNIKNKPIYTFAVKVSQDDKTTDKEVMLLEEVNLYVLKQVNPHFPIIYGVFRCDNVYDEYEKMTPLEQSSFPKELVSIATNEKNKKAVSILNELANGDLRSFMNEYGMNDDLMTNALVQNIIAILSFHSVTNHYHNDTHAGNFLYHKIKKGGYFHYKILNEDYYIENLGYLWVIWDYGMATSMKSKIKTSIEGDYNNLMFNTKRLENKGLISNDITNDTYEDLISSLITDINGKKNILFLGSFTGQKYNKYITNMLKVLVSQGLIQTSISSSPINKSPFVINLPE